MLIRRCLGIIMPTHLHSLASAVINPHRLLDGHVQYEGSGSAVITRPKRERVLDVEAVLKRSWQGVQCIQGVLRLTM